MAAVNGARGTGNVTQALRKPDWSEHINLLQPDATPLTVLSSRLGKKSTINPQFNWAEDDLDPRFSATSAAVTNVATAVPVTAAQGSYFRVNDIVKVPRTGENFRVTAITTDTLTVVRGVGQGGTGVAMNSAEELLIIGSAKPEGDLSDVSKTNNPTTGVNYCQIFRKPIELTQTWIHSDQFVGENDWDYQIRKAGIEHQKDKEEAFLFGRPSEDLTGTQPRRTTGGVLSFITTNVTVAGGTLSESSFNAAMRPAFRYGSKTKLMMTSALVADVLNSYPRSKIQIPVQSADTYGVSVSKFQTTRGMLNLVINDLLEGATYGGYMVILDMDEIKYRYLANAKGSRDTQLLADRQAPDADTKKSEFLAEVGLQFGSEKKHALITGVTG
jgi:hypothetical protein